MKRKNTTLERQENRELREKIFINIYKLKTEELFINNDIFTMINMIYRLSQKELKVFLDMTNILAELYKVD